MDFLDILRTYGRSVQTIPKVPYLHLWAPLDSFLQLTLWYPYSCIDIELESSSNNCQTSMMLVSCTSRYQDIEKRHFQSHLPYFTLDKNTDAIKYLLRANNTTEWMSQLYIKYTAFVIASNLILVPTSALISQINNGNFDANNAVHITELMLVIFFIIQMNL